MLTTDRQRILDSIDKRQTQIRHFESRIRHHTIALEHESARWRAVLWQMAINHWQRAIESKTNELDQLQEDLAISDAAIASQARDQKFLEANERLPFPKELDEDLNPLAALAQEAKKQPLIGRVLQFTEQMQDWVVQTFTPEDPEHPEGNPSDHQLP